ncbi:Hypothetical predicted protein [Paramuricea clavata]|uniref:Uncharacterized protein n=1 Tax=Paramuricea clavata TaxID=317549 RepID=A0A7D9LA60_PARCT|nr:Hypothetical predicted protein [Paramuricea clavata]
MFNEYFVSIFSSDSDVAFEHGDRLHNVEFENITLSEEEVLAVIMNLDHNKAHGPDNIPARLLKETAAQIAPSLCSLFNKSLRIGVVPDDWKLANVVPVYKHGEKAEVENYRPISLLSLISKTLERCVFNNIKHHAYDQINPCQNGFVPKKSCITQLIEVLDHIGRDLDREAPAFHTFYRKAVKDSLITEYNDNLKQSFEKKIKPLADSLRLPLQNQTYSK